MKFKLICMLMLGILSSVGYAEEEPLFVDNVTVKHLEGYKYKITVSGNAPNPGYKNIRLAPYTYMVAPESWEIAVLADAPASGGMMIQVLKPYTISLEHTFSKGVKSVTIVGRTKQVEKKLVAEVKKEEPKSKAPKLEVLHGIKVKGGKVTISVTSNGCTSKKDFVVQIDKAGECPAISIYRKNPDLCEMVATVIDLTFSKEELHLKGFKEFTIRNHFSIKKMK